VELAQHRFDPGTLAGAFTTQMILSANTASNTAVMRLFPLFLEMGVSGTAEPAGKGQEQQPEDERRQPDPKSPLVRFNTFNLGIHCAQKEADPTRGFKLNAGRQIARQPAELRLIADLPGDVPTPPPIAAGADGQRRLPWRRWAVRRTARTFSSSAIIPAPGVPPPRAGH